MSKKLNAVLTMAAYESVSRLVHRIRYSGAAWPGALNGRNVLVVGAGAGLGAATAIRMADNGAFVVAAGLLEQPKLNLAAGERRELGLKAVGERCGLPHVVIDVCDDESVYRGVDQAATILREASGRAEIDFLVIVAGVADPGLQLDNLPGDGVLQERMYDINVRGAQRVRRHASHYVRQARGSVTQFCSMAGIVPLGSMGSYAGGKAAGIAELEALDQEEWLCGIAVTAVIPAMVDSRMTDHGKKSGAARMLRRLIEQTTVPQDEAIELIVRGIARRQRRVYIPRMLRFVDFMPPVLLRSYKLATRVLAAFVVEDHANERLSSRKHTAA